MKYPVLFSQTSRKFYIRYCIFEILGYSLDPSIGDMQVPDTVIGDVEKAKEMKGETELHLKKLVVLS